MFLIIEGIHNTGKTTLVESLSNKFKVFSCRRAFPDLVDSANAQVTDFSFGVNCSISWFAKELSTNDVLFDRLHMSEYAYSTVIRHADEIKAFKHFRMIDTALSKCNVRVIVLTCSYDIMLSRLQEKNSKYCKDDYDTLTLAFEKAHNATLIPSVLIDTGSFSKLEVCDIALEFIQRDIS
jgi:thymidylate kinase